MPNATPLQRLTGVRRGTSIGIRLQAFKDCADGSTEARQRVGIFENLVLLQRVDAAVRVVDLNCPRPEKDRPDALAAVFEIQPDFGLQTVGGFRRHDFNSKVRRIPKLYLDFPVEALIVQHAQIWHQNEVVVQPVCRLGIYLASPVLLESWDQDFIEIRFHAFVRGPAARHVNHLTMD